MIPFGVGYKYNFKNPPGIPWGHLESRIASIRAALAPALFDTWRRRVTLDLLKTKVGELTERKAQLERECEARRDERCTRARFLRPKTKR